jgi:hypothetical protein
MPYARKRTFRRYKRRTSRRSRPYAKRRKTMSSIRGRRTSQRYSKRLYKRTRARTGPFESLGNRTIPNEKYGVMKWHEPTTLDFLFTTNGATQEVYMGEVYDCTSPCFFKPYSDVIQVPYDNIATNWDTMSIKYQRAQTMRTQFTFKFMMDSQLGGDAIPNQIMFGVYLSNVNLNVPAGRRFCSWEDLKRSGNVITKTANQFATPTTITANVNVPKCVAASDRVDNLSIVFPKNQLYVYNETTAQWDVNLPNVASSYPAEQQLYLYPFMVPLSQPFDIGAPLKVQMMITAQKYVKFDRPIQNITTVQRLDNYPAVKSALPSNFVQRPLRPFTYPTQDALEQAIDNLEQSHNEYDFQDVQANLRLDDIEADQVLQDQTLATQVSILNDSIDDNTTLIQQHAALEGKAAH